MLWICTQSDDGPEQLCRYSDSLWAGQSGDRISVGTRFTAPVQTDPGAHPASYTVATRSFPEVERPGRDADSPSPSTAEVKETVELYICSPSGPSWPVVGWTSPLPLPLPYTDQFSIIWRRYHFTVIASRFQPLSPNATGLVSILFWICTDWRLANTQHRHWLLLLFCTRGEETEKIKQKISVFVFEYSTHLFFWVGAIDN